MACTFLGLSMHMGKLFFRKPGAVYTTTGSNVRRFTATEILFWIAFSILPQKLGHPNYLPQDQSLLEFCLPQPVKLGQCLNRSDSTWKDTPALRQSKFTIKVHFCPSMCHIPATMEIIIATLFCCVSFQVYVCSKNNTTMISFRGMYCYERLGCL